MRVAFFINCSQSDRMSNNYVKINCAWSWLGSWLEAMARAAGDGSEALDQD